MDKPDNIHAYMGSLIYSEKDMPHTTKYTRSELLKDPEFLSKHGLMVVPEMGCLGTALRIVVHKYLGGFTHLPDYLKEPLKEYLLRYVQPVDQYIGILELSWRRKSQSEEDS